MKRRWELCPKIGSEVCAHILFTVYRIHAHDESEERTKERVRERSRVSEESASVWECTRALYHRVRTMRVQLRIQSQPYWMNLVRALNLSSPFNSIFVPIFTKWKIRPGSHACPVLWISCACFQFFGSCSLCFSYAHFLLDLFEYHELREFSRAQFH